MRANALRSGTRKDGSPYENTFTNPLRSGRGGGRIRPNIGFEAATERRTMIDREKAITELGRLRNRHVAKLLSFLGESPPYLETAVKRSLTMFAEDVETNIINSDNGENSDDRDGTE